MASNSSRQPNNASPPYLNGTSGHGPGRLSPVPEVPSEAAHASESSSTAESGAPSVVWQAALAEGRAVATAEAPRRTEFALKALGLAELFRLGLREVRLQGDETYTLELSSPEGPSTGGGKQALQHVKLVPSTGGATIVAGGANQLENVVELRTWDYLARLHGQRFKGATLPFPRDLYGQMLKRVEIFFSSQGLRVVMVDVPRGAESPVDERPIRNAPWAPLAAAFVALALAAFAAWRFVH